MTMETTDLHISITITQRKMMTRRRRMQTTRKASMMMMKRMTMLNTSRSLPSLQPPSTS